MPDRKEVMGTMTGHQLNLVIVIAGIPIMLVPFCMQMALYDGHDGGHRSLYALAFAICLSLFLAWTIVTDI